MTPGPIMPKDPDEPALEQFAETPQPGLAAEMLDFLIYHQAWWLTPIVVALVFFGVLLALASTGAAPFIYTLF